jgi:hypothetical protein
MQPSEFLDALVADLVPTRPATPQSRVLLLWCLSSWVIVAAAILAGGPLREGFAGELMVSPRYALELGLGLGAGFAAIWAGLEIGVPGGPSPARRWCPPLILIAAWTFIVALGLFQPSTPPSMNGKRIYCFAQILLASLPPLILAIHFLRPRLAYARSSAGFLVGVAAAAIPALWMQVACRTGAAHVLSHHLFPILLSAAFGAVVAQRALSRA